MLNIHNQFVSQHTLDRTVCWSSVVACWLKVRVRVRVRVRAGARDCTRCVSFFFAVVL